MTTEADTTCLAPKGRTWTKEEDAVVYRHLDSADTSTPFKRWSHVATELPGRTGRQVRDRWNNYLNPAIDHEPFTLEDDVKLWNGYKKIGSKWVVLAMKVFRSRRSENQVKNRWYSATFKQFVSEKYGKGEYDSATHQQQGEESSCDVLKMSAVEQVTPDAPKVAKFAPSLAAVGTTPKTNKQNPRVVAPKDGGGKKRQSLASLQDDSIQPFSVPKEGDIIQPKENNIIHSVSPAEVNKIHLVTPREGSIIQSLASMEGSVIRSLASMEGKKGTIVHTPSPKEDGNLSRFPFINRTSPRGRAGRTWTKEEDAIVSRAVLGERDPPFTKWSDLAATQLTGRTGKQIRDRWNNYLNPAINHLPWVPHEDLRLWRAHVELGKKWTEIGIEKFHETRSENQIKNRWYSAAFKKFVRNEIGKDAYEEAKQHNPQIVKTYKDGCWVYSRPVVHMPQLRSDASRSEEGKKVHPMIQKPQVDPDGLLTPTTSTKRRKCQQDGITDI
eukprot:CAMPEP_0181107262 /NCGR_PEP_ID=MMETSP1071-20121207/16988_1 /TAXON_ID=35127 /ORGANISM="Thalassiosira sp., Strain NH16" /LENGTH=497 /DNA_ID=CAMNT_0023190757 /DNA_START=246 /DNA_END=1739 /DNA_ORIENTATION=-